MKIIALNSKQDFAATYFAKLIWDESHSIDINDSAWRVSVAKYFKLNLDKIRSIKIINSQIRQDLFF